MSLILDALNRSREEAKPIPGLTTHHSVEQVAVNRRQYLLWVALSGAIIVIAWLFMERYSAPQIPARVINVGVEAIGEQEAAAEQAVRLTVPSTPSVAQVSTPVVVDQQLAPVASAARLTAPPPSEEPLPPQEALTSEKVQRSASTVIAQSDRLSTSSPSANDAVAELYANPPVAQEPVIRQPQRQPIARSTVGAESADTPIDVDKILKMAQEEAKNTGLIESPVPLLMDLSQQFKDSVPTVYYLRHDYSSDASRSTVVLNSKTLSVGGSPAAGMKVEEILPDSVVLNYQGTQFRLRGLNSWINL